MTETNRAIVDHTWGEVENKASVISLCFVLKSRVVVGVNGGTIGDTTSPIQSFTEGPTNG